MQAWVASSKQSLSENRYEKDSEVAYTTLHACSWDCPGVDGKDDSFRTDEFAPDRNFLDRPFL